MELALYQGPERRRPALKPIAPVSVGDFSLTQIIRFPMERAAQDFALTPIDWSGLYTTLTIANQFAGMDDAEIESALRETLNSSASAGESPVHQMVRKNGEAIDTLRKSISFLSGMDQRILAAAHRVLQQRLER